MPDDSGPSFRASQSAHATAIAFERNLMDKLGVPRSEARKVLQSLRVRQQNTDNLPAVQLAPTIANGGVTPMGPVVLGANRILGNNGKPKTDTPAMPLATKLFTAWNNGDLNTTKFYIEQ